MPFPFCTIDEPQLFLCKTNSSTCALSSAQEHCSAIPFSHVLLIASPLHRIISVSVHRSCNFFHLKKKSALFPIWLQFHICAPIYTISLGKSSSIFTLLNFSSPSLLNLHQPGFPPHNSPENVVLDVTNVFHIDKSNTYFPSFIWLDLAVFDTDDQSVPWNIFFTSCREHRLS